MKREAFFLSHLSYDSLCEESYLNNFLLKLHSIESDADEKDWHAQNAEKNKSFFAIPDKSGMLMFSGSDDQESIPPGSVYVMTLCGPVMPETSWNVPGLDLLTAQLTWAANEENIAAIVFQLETGGGSTYGLWQFCDIVKSVAAQKPVVIHVNGMSASAGVAIHSSATETYSSHASTRIGSIGAAMSYLDIIGIFEKWGAKFHYVNAPSNPDKNAAFVEMRAGKYDRIEKELSELHAEFKIMVKENRGEVPDDAMTGKMYNTTQAIDMNLVDGIATLEQAVSRAKQLSQTNTQII